MAEKQMSVRLVAVGGKQVKAELMDVGKTGKQAFQEIERSSGRMASGVQNAAFQVGDLFVQVGAGTPVLRAAAMQLPQLLGGLGVFGALAGAAASVAYVLYQNFADGSEKAMTAEERQKALNEAVRDYQDAAAVALTPMSDVIEKYGDMAQAVREVQLAEAELARARAVRAVSDTITSLPGGDAITGLSAEQLAGAEAAKRAADELYERVTRLQASMSAETARFFDFTEDFAEIDRLRGEVDQVNSAIAEMAGEMGLTEDQARAIAVAFADVRAAANGSAQDQVAAGQALVEALTAAYGSLDAADKATGGLVSQLLAAVQAAADVAAQDMAGPIGAAADQAARLAANLLAAAQQRIAAEGLVYSGRGGDPRNSNNQGYGEFGRKSLDEIIAEETAKLNRGAKTGGGGGGMSEAQKAERDALREVEKLYRETRTEAEKFAKEQADINKLFADGYIDAELHARGLAMLEEKYHGATNAAKFFEDIQDDLKESILDMAVTGEASFDRIADAIKRAALQMLLFGEGPFAGAFGGGFKGILGGILSFDGGGWTGGGSRSGGLDGKGGFMALLHPREHVVDTTKAGGQMAAQRVEVGVTVGVDETGNLAVRQVAQRAAGEAVANYDRALPGRVAQIQKKPRMR